MEIKIQAHDQKPELAVMTLIGDLDGSNFQDVINAAQTAQVKGARYLLIDMTEVPFMGSAGLVALHSITLTMQGKQPPSTEDGWGAFRAIADTIEAGMQHHVKILNPQPSVERALEKSGMKQFLEIFTDRELALSSF